MFKTIGTRSSLRVKLFYSKNSIFDRDFQDTALGVLDISYNDSSEQAYNILSTTLSDFNNKTTIEIAHDAQHLQFISHPCCQKWLTKKLFGHLKVNELSWGLFRLPYWFKVS